ncbi:alpha/beta fold hydrolase [Aquabacterium sp.]|uniref:alpha/beta fold hydrolase n=1 Tax=Aquabacterium sp. TaxID=1872578 RepID=UPI003783E98D
MFIERPDARLFSLSFGQGPRTLLAIGGWIGSGELWHEVFGQLPHWRCVSLDHRGSGASHCGAEAIGHEAMVQDLAAVADAQRIDRCVLAAESSGVAVALLHGDRAAIAPPAESQRLAAALPQATLHLLPGLGHVPMLSAPARLAQAIEQRFGRQECAATAS